jgi:hypothetical protein
MKGLGNEANLDGPGFHPDKSDLAVGQIYPDLLKRSSNENANQLHVLQT